MQVRYLAALRPDERRISYRLSRFNLSCTLASGASSNAAKPLRPDRYDAGKAIQRPGNVVGSRLR